MPKIKDLGIKVIPETIRPPEVGAGGGCTDCTVQPFSICGGTQQQGCTDCTMQPLSICGGTHQGCTDCTVQPFSICGGTQQQAAAMAARGCAFTGCDCSFVTCGWISCRVFTCGYNSCGFTCRYFSDPCRVTFLQQAELTREQIAELRDQLQKQMAALDEHAKTIGAKTAQEIDAREKQLNEELAELKARRKNLK